ncbi:MAG: hypothetical protein M3Y72_07390 [Acidobacteriota bacterium]|nr:hypothetical protein [Acidobacteriota bacterium]
MQPAIGRIQSLIAATRARHLNRVRSSAVVALLLALLLWQTQWPSLKAGLVLLLIGYGGAASLLLYRAFALRRWTVRSPELMRWFDDEQAFASRLMLFESVTRGAGFLVLGYGIWIATRNALLAIGLGIAYPAFAYFLLERKNYERAKRSLQIEKEAAAALFAKSE